MTILETKLIAAVATSLYTPVNGEEPDSVDEAVTHLALEDFAEDMGCSVKQVEGVLTSCKKKGLVWADAETVGLTPKGFEAYKTK